jgi:tetratricopeptide (TPR) repeat protein
MLHRILLFLIVFITAQSWSQTTDQQLAQHYYSNGEYDKALMYYEKMYESDESKFNLTRYVDCLEQTGDIKNAEKTLKKAASKNNGDQELTVLLASFYENHDEVEKANDLYTELIDNLTNSSRDIIDLYTIFKGKSKPKMAFATLEKGRKLLKNSYPLNIQFAEYYGAQGETEKMINEYLDLLDYHPAYMSSVQRILSAQVDFTEENSKEYDLLRTALIERTQKKPNDLNYSEMLTWLFIQRQNFTAALVHIKAIDKRSNSLGAMVYDFGSICIENKDYATARNAYKYVVEIGEQGRYYMRAQSSLLNVSFLEVTTNRNFSQTELDEILTDYQNVLNRFGKKNTTLPVILEMAHIQAFYANKGTDAIVLLNEALEFSGLTDMQLAQVKMQLADIHVLHGDIWEASLFYMQIDKEFKYEVIGQEAKFKNARIFYYDGEFDFAQSQLDVLKQSTSKLIANDALKLSLLITDNYGLDSNFTAMYNFAQADLFIEQHRYEEAFYLFDSILAEFPAHSLGDEILLKKAYALQLKGQWNLAIQNLEKIVKYHAQDILADDALFQLGDIYQNHLMDNVKAAEFYRIILFEHKGSLYTTEARKRFQELRQFLPKEEKEI